MTKEKDLYSFKGLIKYCNEVFCVKKTGKPFTSSDVQQYIKTGNLPKYLGNIIIEQKVTDQGHKLFKVTKV